MILFINSRILWRPFNPWQLEQVMIGILSSVVEVNAQSVNASYSQNVPGASHPMALVLMETASLALRLVEGDRTGHSYQ